MSQRTFQLRDLLNLNILLIFFPIALTGQLAGWSEILVFICSALAIIPLAGLIGEATEVLAEKLGPHVGGLLNATMGNAAELIITFFALRGGLLELVKASIVGSVLGNLLLVLGMSTLLGGLKNGLQTFDRRTASRNATLVILAFMVLAIPSVFDSAILGKAPTEATAQGRELAFSLGIAALMIVIYILSVFYTLRNPEGSVAQTIRQTQEIIVKPAINMRNSILLLIAATIGVAVMSEILVGTVEPVVKQLGLSEFFVGIILIPIIGNVSEHVVAVQVALKNRMDLSLGISLGSSLQVALFVAPVLVFVSLFFEQRLLLVFNPYELLALGVGTIVATLVSQDGESNWLEGAELIAVYLILALAFFLVGT
ncbi:MAG TPA: calcium/proton exchanger [Aggregatilineales bacterium]|nr:calcium/proton exchanger [Aggregatilineales bacterium]